MRRAAFVVGLTLISSNAFAQFGGGGGMQPGGGPPPSNVGDTKEGPAEAAPQQQETLPALQPLPAWPNQREKTLQFFQLNGYMRFRPQMFYNFHLSFHESVSGGPVAPFPIPYSEVGSTGLANPPNGAVNPASSCAAREKSNCASNLLTSADMRLRLEPTINVTEQVRVKAQFDVFDNFVMGSTPENYYLNGRKGTQDVPLTAFSRNQVAPEGGSNSVYSSFRVKRAWAEVRTPIGELRFGRMPSHWGMGMLVNNGDCLDCDYGVNADRVMFATKLWGHFFAFLWDWVATGPTTQIVGPQYGQGVFYNADPLDDVSQWILALGKMDKPEELKDKLDRGKIVFNYGGYFVYRQQDWAQSANPTTPEGNSNGTLQSALAPRQAKAGIFDIWLRLNWKKLHLEAEGALIYGNLGNIQDQFSAVAGSTKILTGGFTFRGSYKLLRDALKLGLEIGYASGDGNEDPNANINFRLANVIPRNNRVGRFYFDPDYIVDQILFRRIMGTVYNATYFKASGTYDIVDNFGARLDLIYSLANNPVGFPGNATNLGVELDISALYKNEEDGFYAGLTYGVLFPLAALNHPGSIYTPMFAKDAETAQILRAQLAVKF